MSYFNGAKIITQNLSNYYDAGNLKSYVTGSTVWRNIIGGGLVSLPSLMAYQSSALNLQGNPAWTFPFNFTPNFTVELWYKTYTTGSAFTDQSKSPGIIQIGTYNGNGSLTLWDWSQGQAIGNHSIRSFINNGATWTTSQGSSTTYSDPAWLDWHQIVMVFDGATKWDRYNLYIDKVPQFSYNFVGSSFPSSSIAGGNNIYITGAAGGATNNDYAILRTYNYAMNLQDIINNYNNTKGRFGLT
jgi:hypothetical protein